jgi:hypothetical protein
MRADLSARICTFVTSGWISAQPFYQITDAGVNPRWANSKNLAMCTVAESEIWGIEGGFQMSWFVELIQQGVCSLLSKFMCK